MSLTVEVLMTIAMLCQQKSPEKQVECQKTFQEDALKAIREAAKVMKTLFYVQPGVRFSGVSPDEWLKKWGKYGN